MLARSRLTQLLNSSESDRGLHVEHLLHVELLHGNLADDTPEGILVPRVSPHLEELLTCHLFHAIEDIFLEHVQQPRNIVLIEQT